MGCVTVVDPGADKPLVEMGTAQCVHCGGHFPICPGSGRLRGWCQSCHGPVCGLGCAECVPVQQYLDNLEKGRPANYKPIQAFVPRMI